MRILIVIHSLNSGGAERVTANLSRAWAEQGWNVSVATIASAELDFFQLHPAVKRIALNLAGDSAGLFTAVLANARRVWALRRVIQEEHPDIVLGMMTSSGVLAVLAGWGLSCRVFVSERIYPPMIPLGAFWECLRRWVYPKATGVVALTKEGQAWIERNCPGSNVAVIPNYVLWPLDSGEPYLKPEIVVPAKRLLLLAVGRLGEQKQFGMLIDAFASLAEDYENWDLVVLGEGIERHALDTQILGLGLGDRVKLPGRAGNLADWYQRADLFVLCSRFEGFPNVLAEAMAYGLPAVSFDCDTGPRDIIRHEVDGLLIPPGEADSLAAVLDRLMGDEFLRKQYAARAVDTRERFSMERIAGMWEELLIHGS